MLDECTSAVSADGEENLYKRLHESGITLLSIAHRPALKKYRSNIYLNFYDIPVIMTSSMTLCMHI